MQTLTVTISGITCGACVKLITKRISRIEGVQQVTIDKSSGATNINSDVAITSEKIQQVLEGTQYSVL